MRLDQDNHGHGNDHHQPTSSSDGGSSGDISGAEPLHAGFSRTLSSAFSFSASCPSSPTLSSPSPSTSTSTKILVKKSSLRKSLRRLDSSHRLSITCSGSDLTQLYLSSPELDATTAANNLLSSSPPSPPSDHDSNVVGMRRRHILSSSSSSSSSWLQAADLFGRRKSFRRNSSYARFLDMDVMTIMSETIDEIGEEEERTMLLIEETYGHNNEQQENTNTKRKNKSTPRQEKCLPSCCKSIKSPAIAIPLMMIIDLILGVALSLYDSNLLRNVPGFRFPLCYAFTQKFTNALASFLLICLSRRWEAEERASRMKVEQNAATTNTMTSSVDSMDHQLPLTELPCIRTFRQHLVPLSAVALVQTISSAFANQSLQIIPLPLFKVCLMCGPIFVAFITSMMEGSQSQLYSKGRMMALGLIGIGACRAVYAEAGGADNPRYIMEGAGYALGASAFGGIGLVLSSALMHRGDDGGSNDQEEDDGSSIIDGENVFQSVQQGSELKKKIQEVAELNPLSLLFYLSCEQVLMLSVYLFPLDFVLQENEGENMEEDEPGEFAAFLMYFVQDPTKTIFYLMTGSMMSLTLAVLTFALVNRTSPVATSLLGNVRSIATVAISSMVFGSIGSAGGASGLFGSATFGYTLTLAGGVAYAMAALGNSGSSSK